MSSNVAWGQQPDEVAPEPPVLPETEVEATPPAAPLPIQPNIPFEDGGSILDGTLFDSPAATGYAAESTTTGSLIDIPSIGLPASVDVVTGPLMEDQQIRDFTQALRNMPSAIAAGDGLFADRLFLRGLEVRTRDFRKNGFLDPTFTPRDFANIERVEILKGPASVLYGSAAPSGTVNFITKKPIDAQFTRFEFQPGSFGQDRYTIDTNGYLNSEGTLLYRFNGAYEDSDSFRDFGFTERHLLAPSLRWLISPDTMLTWEVEIIEDDRRGDTGIPAIDGDPLALPRNRYIGEPANDFLHTEDYRTSVVLNHQFENDWSLYVGASTVFYEFPGSQTFPVAQIGPTSFARLRQDFFDTENSSSLIANLAGDMCLLGMKHRLLFGTEHVYYDTESAFAGFSIDPIDAANPVYTNPAVGAAAFNSQFPVFRQVRHGYYLQDLVELSPHWQVLAGVRFDDVDLTFDRNSIRTEQRFQRTTPRAGIVYQPVPGWLSFYGNYSRSFNPPGGGGFGPTNDPRLPELGESYEAGMKAWLLPDLMLHAAGFHITRENVPFQQRVPPFGFFQTARERSQGAEVELLGELTEQWLIVANYSYTDTELTDPSNPTVFFGQRQRNVPYHQSSLWTRYNLIDDCCQTFGAAIGYVYVGNRSANVADTVQLPSYARWDAGIYWRRGRLDAMVYLENLFDREYAASSINEFQIFPGAPFNARAQLGVTF